MFKSRQNFYGRKGGRGSIRAIKSARMEPPDCFLRSTYLYFLCNQVYQKFIHKVFKSSQKFYGRKGGRGSDRAIKSARMEPPARFIP